MSSPAAASLTGIVVDLDRRRPPECSAPDPNDRRRRGRNGQLNAGVAFALYSGRPYSMTTGTDVFNTGRADAQPPGVPRNSLDGRPMLIWIFAGRSDSRSHEEGGRAVLTFGIDAFNDLNHVNDTAYIGTLTSPSMSRVAVA